MSLRDSFLPDFDHEMAVTRHVLERLPEAAFGWKPHEKSYALGGLATHLAQVPRWGSSILRHEFHDLAASKGAGTPGAASLEAVLETFDKHVADVRKRLCEMSDAELMAPWALKRGSHLVMSLPKVAALRRFLLHHMIHHRGQLTVYLRMQGVPLPPIYGPTADEGM
jgi:uncharacterized damage-inducible protein DinB